MKGGPRKLLVAAVGVATINYVGCGKRTTPHDANAKDADIIVTSGNLPTAEPYVPDAGPVLQGGGIDATIPGTVGNLPAPPDAGLGRLRGK